MLSLDGRKGMVSGPPGVLYDLATGNEIIGVPGGQGGTGSRPTISSPDLKTVICFESAYDRTSKPFCRVWDLEGQKKLAEVEIPTALGRITAAVSPSGERLVVAAYLDDTRGSSPATIVIEGWDIKTGKRLGTVEGPKLVGDIQIVAASESIAIVNTLGKARLIDFESGKLGEEFETGHLRDILRVTQTPSPAVLSPDRKRFALGVDLEEPGTFGVRIFEWPSAKPLHTFKGHTGMVSALRFSADGKQLASGSYDGTVLVWDLAAIGK
jgi:WD40 repeat protein